jgi:hypothetical protein
MCPPATHGLAPRCKADACLRAEPEHFMASCHGFISVQFETSIYVLAAITASKVAQSVRLMDIFNGFRPNRLATMLALRGALEYVARSGCIYKCFLSRHLNHGFDSMLGPAGSFSQVVPIRARVLGVQVAPVWQCESLKTHIMGYSGSKHTHACTICALKSTIACPHFHMMPWSMLAKMCFPSAATTSEVIATFALFQSSQASLLFGSHLRFIHRQGLLAVVVVCNDYHCYEYVRRPCSSAQTPTST